MTIRPYRDETERSLLVLEEQSAELAFLMRQVLNASRNEDDAKTREELQRATMLSQWLTFRLLDVLHGGR